MATTIEELETLAMQLPIRERSELAHRLIVSIDSEPEGTPEEIAKAWDEEIARRVAEIDAGTAVLIPAEEVLARLDEKLKQARK
jgi:putative addiction module component (TIGR02574 family)